MYTQTHVRILFLPSFFLLLSLHFHILNRFPPFSFLLKKKKGKSQIFHCRGEKLNRVFTGENHILYVNAKRLFLSPFSQSCVTIMDCSPDGMIQQTKGEVGQTIIPMPLRFLLSIHVVCIAGKLTGFKLAYFLDFLKLLKKMTRCQIRSVLKV